MSYHRVCCCGGVCRQCHPFLNGTNPSSAIVSSAKTCTDLNQTHTYIGAVASDINDDRCLWRWGKVASPYGYTASLIYAKRAFTFEPLRSNIALVAGDYVIAIGRSNLGGGSSGAYFQSEKTTGFSCDPSTGKVSGTHAFSVGAVEDQAGCSETGITVTVAA